MDTIAAAKRRALPKPRGATDHIQLLSALASVTTAKEASDERAPFCRLWQIS